MTNDQNLPVVVPRVVQPYEKIIVTNLGGNAGPLSSAMVFQIPPTCAEHNVVMELLKRIRVEWPGAWFCAQEWERKQYPVRIGPLPQVAAEAKIKRVSREHLGLPPEDPIADVPA